MKIIILSFFIFLSGFIYAQEVYDDNKYAGAFAPQFINHTPSARAEAMGKGQVANNSGEYGSYFNPALTSLSKGFKIDLSYTEVGNIKPSLSYHGVSYSNNKFGSLGVTAYYFSKDKDHHYWYDQKYSGAYYDAIYTVNYSREVVKDFYAGVNFGVFHYSNYFYSLTGFDTPVIDDGVTLDIGLLKKFNLQTKSTQQAIRLGTALYNITGSKITSTSDYGSIYKDPLPVIFRIGASHEIKLTGNPEIEPSEFSFFTHAEYEKFLNSKFDVVFKLGEEITIKEIVHLRAGYYYSEVGDADYTGGYQSEFTGGVGVSIPLDKIFKTKNSFKLKIDFTSLAPPMDRKYFYYNSASEDNYSNNNNKTIGLSINYIP